MSLLIFRRKAIMTLSALALGSGFLAAQHVRAQTPSLTLQGTLTYRERIALPAARAEIRLLDVSNISDNPHVITTDTMDINQQVPIPFHLCINRNLLKAGHAYALSAIIFVDGQVWFKTPSPAPVSQKAKTNLTIILHRQTTEATPHTLRGSWHTDKIGQISLRDGTITPTLDFHDDGTLTGSTVCNNIAGRYSLKGQSLSFLAITSTIMACKDSTVAQRETAFMHALRTVKNWKISAQNDVLTLSNDAREPVLVLHRQSHIPVR